MSALALWPERCAVFMQLACDSKLNFRILVKALYLSINDLKSCKNVL
jgi:hypothetical protein